MSKICPTDGMKYLTNLSQRFLNESQKLAAVDPDGNPKWTSFELGKLLEEHGFVKLKYIAEGKAYTYTCIKGINLQEVERLAHFQQVYKSVQESKNYQSHFKKKSS